LVVAVGAGRGLGEVLDGGEESVEGDGGEALVGCGIEGGRGVVAIVAQGWGRSRRGRGGVEVGQDYALPGHAKKATSGMPRVRKPGEEALPAWELSAKTR